MTRARAAKAEAAKSNEAPQRDLGFVALCDIAAFSEKKEAAQKRCVTHLEQAVAATRLMKDVLAAQSAKYVLNCTGDGFILITTAPPVRNHPDFLLDFVAELLTAIRDWNGSDDARDNPELRYAVRIGIHTGTFWMGLRVFGAPNAIGPGVNIAARVASVGDPGHVLISDDVLKHIRETEAPPRSELPNKTGREGLEHFLNNNAGGWSVAVKHGVDLTVYPWSVDRGQGLLGSIEKPRKVRIFENVQRQLINELASICEELEGILHDFDSRLTPKSLDLRLTVLFANRKESRLVCTPIRFARTNHERQTIHSDTKYPIEEDSNWGMPARILLNHTGVVWHTELPRWPHEIGPRHDRARASYALQLQERWGTPRGEVDKLGRKARAYFGTALAGMDLIPFGVLMVDSMHPLPIDLEKQGTAGEVLQEGARRKLPSLLHIRYSP